MYFADWKYEKNISTHLETFAIKVIHSCRISLNFTFLNKLLLWKLYYIINNKRELVAVIIVQSVLKISAILIY